MVSTEHGIYFVCRLKSNLGGKIGDSRNTLETVYLQGAAIATPTVLVVQLYVVAVELQLLIIRPSQGGALYFGDQPILESLENSLP
jgi:hypothetical protein